MSSPSCWTGCAARYNKGATRGHCRERRIRVGGTAAKTRSGVVTRLMPATPVKFWMDMFMNAEGIGQRRFNGLENTLKGYRDEMVGPRAGRRDPAAR